MPLLTSPGTSDYAPAQVPAAASLCCCCCAPQAAPPSVAYVARLVKALIAAAEDQHQELSEGLLGLQTALLMQGDRVQAVQVGVCQVVC
jgi:hypothetical protein